MTRKQLDLMLTATNLKDVERTGWGLRGVADPESVADHSWGVALLCLLYAGEAGVDPGEAVRMAVVHDLPEAVIGDLLPGDEEKERLEREAIESMPDGDEAKELWRTYFERGSDVARFVKDMDLCEMCLQALAYEEQDRSEESLADFFSSAEDRLSTETGRNLFAEIKRKYSQGKR